MPKISVVMPVYNGEEYLREAIDSILNQTFSDFEFIIINDASTDKTEEIIKSYNDERIIYLKNENNLGVAATLNKGLDIATGEYIARMDADDISLPSRFEKQVKFMDKHSDIAVCGSAIECFGEGQNKKIFAPYGKKVKIGFLISSSLFHPTVMMRRNIIEKEHYRYDNYYNKVEDFDLWMRIIRKYKIDNLHYVLLKYRVHKNQVTQNYDNNYRLLLAEAKNNFLKSVGIELTDIEIHTFNDYCIEKIDYDKQMKDLISALKEIIISNDKLNYFDRKYLRKVFSKIVLRSARLQNIYTKKELIKMAGFVTTTEIQKDGLKCLIKKVTDRK